MNIEYFAPTRFQMALPANVTSVAGGIIFPAGIASHTLVRRNIERKYPHLRRRLIDPQLYLSGLNANTCRKACVKLATYPWFIVPGLTTFDSGRQSQKEWSSRAKEQISAAWPGRAPSRMSDITISIQNAIRFQRDNGCEALILPSPLTSDQTSDYGTEMRWLDEGLRIAAIEAPTLPTMATVAVSDTCLRGFDPEANQLLEIIIDQITARAPSGVYIVIEQSNETGYYCTHHNTIGALIHLIRGIRQGGIARVALGPIGTAGILGAAAGATIWTTGWYRGERRIRLSDFEDQQGMAVPTFYSHPLASEIHLASDLDRLVDARLLSRVSDVTPASANLIRALRAGRKVADVPEWRYGQSNVAAARDHYLRVCLRETENLSAVDESSRMSSIRQWLEQADELARRCFAVGGFNARTELNHQAGWLSAVQKFDASSRL